MTSASPHTRAYLNTRGRERDRDYQFVGSAPAPAWWRAYADHTTFEHPTVLVQSDGQGWQAYLSGIPSRRRDAVGTVIRYTVVAENAPAGPPADEGSGTGDVLALVANWLADQDRGPETGRVSEVLDGAFPEPDLERLIAAAGPAAELEVRDRLAGALHELILPVDAEPDVTPESWLADLSRSAARAAFVRRVDALLAGQPGRALVLNLVGAEADLAGLIDDPRPLVVLAPDLADPGSVVPLNRPDRVSAGSDPFRNDPGKKASAPPGTPPPEPARTPQQPTPAATLASLRGCLRLIMVPIALIMAMALALLGALVYLR